MISKNSDILYLFDFDGTIMGDSIWKSYWKNTWKCIKAKPYLNPSDYDIRWCIITGRPKIDKLIVQLICNSKGLFPEFIFTTSNMLYNKMKDTEIHEYKSFVYSL